MSEHLRPKYFLIGVFVGFIICCITGYYVSTQARLYHFTRFFPAITPEALFYPTASQLLQTARHEVKRDKILVLIGGSSIFRGTGQDPDKLWSNELQKILGDKFKVLNYATNGASLSSYGGVAFRMLKKEYPKIIFVATAYQFDAQGYIDGLDPYKYLFWDAYYKNLFQSDKDEMKIINHLKIAQLKTFSGAEQHISAFLNSFFYFKDLWNWVSYRFFFTTWSDSEFRTPFQAKYLYHDEPTPSDYMEILLKTNRDSEHVKTFRKFIKDSMTNVFVDLSQKPLQIVPSIVAWGTKGYNDLFQPGDRAKILLVQPTYNIDIINSVPKKFQTAYWFYTKQSDLMLKSLGYHVVEVGRDFNGNDYLDLSHFTASGGEKMAKQVAREVKHIAELSGYLN